MSVSYFAFCSSKFFWLKEIVAHPGLERAWKQAVAIEKSDRTAVSDSRDAKLRGILECAAKQVPY